MSKFVPSPPEATPSKGDALKEKKKRFSARERAMHKQKTMVTWFLVFVFTITSVGFIVGIGGGGRGKATSQNQAPRETTDEESTIAEIKHWREEVAKDPNRASNWATLGYYLEKAKMDTDAIADFKKAIELDDKYVFAYAHLGGIYLARKQYKEGIAVLEAALKKTDPKDSGNAKIYMNLAVGYAQAENMAKAHEIVELCIKKYPQEYEPYVLKMRLFEKKKEYKAAIEIAKQAMKVATAMSDPEMIQRFQLEIEVANQLMNPKKSVKPPTGQASPGSTAAPASSKAPASPAPAAETPAPAESATEAPTPVSAPHSESPAPEKVTPTP